MQAVFVFAVCVALVSSAHAQGALTDSAAAATLSSVEVSGVKRIDPDTVRSYLLVKPGDALTKDTVNESLKKLYATELFADVQIEQRGTSLFVKVVENPLVNRVAFEGNDKLDDEDLKTEIQLRPRSIYSRTRVQQDVDRLLDIYQRNGRFNTTVSPKVISRPQNRVDVVFEIEESGIAKVRKINFVGNRVYDADDLKRVINTEESRWYKFFSGGDKYDPDRVAYDKELLRRYYVQSGYADFMVKSVTAELSPSGEGFYLTYAVEEGDKYRFGTVKVESSLPDADPEMLRSYVAVEEGETYDAIAVENTVDTLVDALGNIGYAFIDVDPEINRDPIQNVIDVTFKAEEGSRVYVDRIDIKGNVRTADEVIRREFRLAEGDPFSTSKLRRTEQRLQNLGYFDKVEIATSRGSAPDRADVNVNVTEKSTGELSVGAGFSTVDGALGDISVRERNLLGEGKEINARFMVATERQEAEFGFTEPYFLDREIAAGFDIFKVKYDFRTESSYDREMTGGALRASYALTEHMTHSLNYTLRQEEVSNVPLTASQYVRSQEGDYLTSSVGHVLLYDARNNRFDPTDGYFVRFGQDFAGVGGDAKYVRNDLKAGIFYSFYPQWVAQLSGSGGYIYGWNENVRINDRFFLGGRQVRGFDNAGIGPRDTRTLDSLGGNVYYASTAELNFPLGLPSEANFKGAIFVDAGSLWSVDETGPTVADESSLRAAIGVGIAWGSPFGPIRLDLSRAVAKEEYDETEILKFTFGTRF